MLYTSLIEPSLLASALVIGSLSCYLVGSRTTTAYFAVRRVLVIAFIAGLLRISLEGLKLLTNFASFAFLYGLLTNILEQVFVILSVVTSIGIYLESVDVDVWALFRNIWKRKTLSLFILTIITYSTAVSAYIAIEKPYSLEVTKNLWGSVLNTMFYPTTFLALILPNVLVLMIGVPFVLQLASRKAQNRRLARNLLYLGLSSFIVGAGFLCFTIYQSVSLVDPEDLLYFILSIMFSSASVSFNRASMYAGFLNSPKDRTETYESFLQFSKSIRKDHSNIEGGQFLLEIDVNAAYERTVTDFCLEFSSHGARVFVVTTKSGLLYRSLSNYSGIRFCLFSASVTRPTAEEKEEGRILIPQDSFLEIIEIFESVWRKTPEGEKFAFVFDNLSDRVISIGLENTYKSLKEMLVILADQKVTSLFLLHEKTIDVRALNLLRSLFNNILESTRDRLVVVKEQVR